MNLLSVKCPRNLSLEKKKARLLQFETFVPTKEFIDELGLELLAWSRTSLPLTMGLFFKHHVISIKAYKRWLTQFQRLKMIHKEVLANIGEYRWECAVDRTFSWYAVRDTLWRYSNEFAKDDAYWADLKCYGPIKEAEEQKTIFAGLPQPEISRQEEVQPSQQLVVHIPSVLLEEIHESTVLIRKQHNGYDGFHTGTCRLVKSPEIWHEMQVR